MNPRPSVISEMTWRGAFRAVADGVKMRLAKWAGYNAATPSRNRVMANRYATNPNSTAAQIQRVAMMWGAEYLGKNSAFGVGYLNIRRNYCRPKAFTPDTGDAVLDQELTDYLKGAFARGGTNQSMQQEFTMAFDVEMPVRGDALLLWDRREDGSLFQTVIRQDQIGELYQFVRPFKRPDGLKYFAGMYFRGKERVGFRIYDLGYDQVYLNPQDYEARDCIYGQDNLMPGIRGVTRFHAAIETLEKSDALFQAGMDSARRQAKTAVVVFNSSGSPDELTYDSVQNYEGEVIYAERNAEGAVVEYKFSGDAHQVVRTEAPGPELIQGCKYADERASLALGFPYAVLVNGNATGGADLRLSTNKANGEIDRIRDTLHRPKLDAISYIHIMDAVDRGIFPARPNITRGEWHFGTGPTADAFRETKDDVLSNRAGLESRTHIVAQTGRQFKRVLKEQTDEAVAIAKAVQDANEQLEAEGYEPTVTAADIAQNSDNPAQSAQAEETERTGMPPAANSTPPNGSKGSGNGNGADGKGGRLPALN